jgi:dsRNA-specific ribonuclease
MMLQMLKSVITNGSDTMKDDGSVPTISWIPIHIEEKLDILIQAVHTIQGETAKNNTRLLAKLDKWLFELGSIQEGLKRVREKLVPYLEKTLETHFEHTELFQMAMFQPSTKNLFLELETQYHGCENPPLDFEGFAEMINLSEMAQVLALIGDAVVSSAVLQHLWKPRAADAGRITQRKADIVSNEHMAKLCDKWGLYNYRIHFDPDTPSKLEENHDKGTLVEAVYGIIYIEHEYRKVLKLVVHLINTR